MVNKLQLAEAQFIGFVHGKHGYGVLDLVISMGLTRTEWSSLRNQLTMNASDVTEIDNYFSKKK